MLRGSIESIYIEDDGYGGSRELESLFLAREIGKPKEDNILWEWEDRFEELLEGLRVIFIMSTNGTIFCNKLKFQCIGGDIGSPISPLIRSQPQPRSPDPSHRSFHPPPQGGGGAFNVFHERS